MAKVALVESKPSRTDFIGHFDNSFEFDRYSLALDFNHDIKNDRI